MHLDVTQELPFAESCFDAIFCMDAIHYFGANPGFLPHLIRHLKQGGGCLSAVRASTRNSMRRKLENLPHEYDDGTRLWPEEFSRYHSPQWWADLFRQTGLVNVLISRGTARWRCDVGGRGTVESRARRKIG